MSTHRPSGAIKASPLSQESYRPYGSIIAAFPDLPSRPANKGTARRFDRICQVQNLRGDQAKLNLCIFRCSPRTALPLEIDLLERHRYSSQVFVPMQSTARFLGIVCLGDDWPDLSTLSAFVFDGSWGISYLPGVWHYPMTVLDHPVDFTCLVYEDGSPADCEIVALEPRLRLEL